MIQHAVDQCPDDLMTLRDRLDELAREGSHIMTVVWQPPRTIEGAQGTHNARGGFVIISQHEFPDA